MKKTLNFTCSLSLIALSIMTFNSCKKDKMATGIDKELYEMAKETSGFTWYKNSNELLEKSSGSGHPQPLLRTRYNAIAATQLDTNGKIIPGAVFPEGSLIVKDLYDNTTTLGRYAILFKNTNNTYADANGWVWGYINPNGSIAEPASKKGTSCISCHTQSNNIDYTLMNEYYP